MANESLIFRKGLQANLADTTKCPIRPGAISITIDEPGMYIDLPANAALGHDSDYRVRIGDVISVYGLQDLAALAADDNITADHLSTESATSTNTLKGKINKYSSSALYYVLELNMLLKYNVSTQKFIWINDTSSLQEQITALNGTISNHTDRIGALETKVGSANTNTSGTSNASGLYKVIEDTKAGLEELIAGILGGGNGLSLDSLNTALNKEIQDRQAGDSAIDEKVTGLTTRMGTAETDIDNLEKLIGTKNDASNLNTVFAAINKELERAEEEEGKLDTRLGAIEGLKISETYAKLEDLTALTGTVGTVSGKVTNLENGLEQLSGTVTSNNTTLTNAINAETTRATNAENALEDRIEEIEADYATNTKLLETNNNVTNLSNLVGSAENDKAGDPTVFGAIKSEAARATGVEADLASRLGTLETTAPTLATKEELGAVSSQANTNASNISSLTTNLNTNYYQKTETYNQTKINELVSGATTAAANALKDAKDYTDSEIDKVEKAFADADALLDQKITNINSSLSGYATTDNLEDAVDDLTTAIATAKQEAIEGGAAAAKTYTDTLLNTFKDTYASDKQTMEQEISGLANSKADKTTTYTKDEVNGLVNGINTTIDGLDEQWTADITAAVEAEAAARNEAINGELGVATKLAAHMESATATYETKADATAKLSEAKTYAETKANAALSAAEKTAKEYTDTREAKIREDFAAEDLKLSQSISNIVNNTIPTLATKADTYTKSQVNGLIQEAKDYADDAVENVLRAAEAMRYMGTLTSNDIADELSKKTGVEAGDVWVVGTAAMDLTDGYHPGDMFIASKDGASAIADWNHVKTGYDANLEQKFHSTVETNGGKVALDSIGTLDTGSIAFKASADTDGNYTSAIRVTMTTDSAGTGNHGVATIGMVWEDF